MLRRQVKKIINKVSINNYQTLNTIELSKSRLLSNVSYFRNNNSNLSIIPVLKSNAYGHGLLEIAEILNDADCSFLGVDGYFEAAKIRDITNHKILVLGYIRPENVKLLDTKKCSFVVQDIDGLRALSSLGKPVKIHIELNTGMNRLGLQPNELDSYLQAIKTLPNLIVDGVMTHLADADNPESDSYTNNQVALFDKLVEKVFSEGLSPSHIHIAQTAGSTKVISKYANSTRIGIGLYGINPLQTNDKFFGELEKLKPVLELKSTIVKVMDLKAGDRVSYNGIFTADKSSRIGVLPLGYYEGVPRELSNKGLVSHANKYLNIVGRVCMNHTMIDLAETVTGVGSIVTVISNNPKHKNSIKYICESNKLFNYTLMTGISESTRRIIIE